MLCLHKQVCRYNDGVNEWCKSTYKCPHFNDIKAKNNVTNTQ